MKTKGKLFSKPKLMNELLSNYDLIYYSKLLKIPLIEITSKDLFNFKPKEGGYIINMEDHDEGNGTHWTALVIKKNVAIYYDSYGLIPPKDIVEFIRKNKRMPIVYSTDQIQSLTSVLCGWYCLFFLYFFLIMHKKSDAKASYLLNKHNVLFTDSKLRLNDKILQQLIKNIMNDNKIYI